MVAPNWVYTGAASAGSVVTRLGPAVAATTPWSAVVALAARVDKHGDMTCSELADDHASHKKMEACADSIKETDPELSAAILELSRAGRNEVVSLACAKGCTWAKALDLCHGSDRNS